MTAGPSIDPARFLYEPLSQASRDLMRELLTTFVNALLSEPSRVLYRSYTGCGSEVALEQVGVLLPRRLGDRGPHRRLFT